VTLSGDGEHDGESIRVGDISNSTGIAIGTGAQAIVNQRGWAARDGLSTLLSDFILSLGRYRDFLEDAGSVQEAAIDVRTEVARPSPKWQSVRSALTAIAASVTAVATLSDAINNIQALVERIIG
jgi:hypothetical protein